MSKFRDFGSQSLEGREAISFKIHDEEFHCIKAVQGSSDPADQARVIDDFFTNVLVEESLVRFNSLLTDKERIVTTETLADITSWLIEQYTDRPNQQPED